MDDYKGQRSDDDTTEMDIVLFNTDNGGDNDAVATAETQSR